MKNYTGKLEQNLEFSYASSIKSQEHLVVPLTEVCSSSNEMDICKEENLGSNIEEKVLSIASHLGTKNIPTEVKLSCTRIEDSCTNTNIDINKMDIESIQIEFTYEKMIKDSINTLLYFLNSYNFNGVYELLNTQFPLFMNLQGHRIFIAISKIKLFYLLRLPDISKAEEFLNDFFENYYGTTDFSKEAFSLFEHILTLQYNLRIELISKFYKKIITKFVFKLKKDLLENIEFVSNNVENLVKELENKYNTSKGQDYMSDPEKELIEDFKNETEVEKFYVQYQYQSPNQNLIDKNQTKVEELFSKETLQTQECGSTDAISNFLAYVEKQNSHTFDTSKSKISLTENLLKKSNFQETSFRIENINKSMSVSTQNESSAVDCQKNLSFSNTFKKKAEPVLKTFFPKFSKKDTIDKRILRSFRRFVIEYHKKFEQELKSNPFWKDFVDDNLLPPLVYTDKSTITDLNREGTVVQFKSFGTSYCSWLFSQKDAILVYKAYTSRNGDVLLEGFINDYKIKDKIQIDQLSDYIFSMPFYYVRKEEESLPALNPKFSDDIFDSILGPDYNINSIEEDDLFPSYRSIRQISKEEKRRRRMNRREYQQNDDVEIDYPKQCPPYSSYYSRSNSSGKEE